MRRRVDQDSNYSEIDELLLTAPHRHQGIGTKTLHFVAEQCRRLGIQALHLEVEHTNFSTLFSFTPVQFDQTEKSTIS